MKKTELLIKSREAMLSAVQIYNNPQVTFKSEAFITLSVIAWTYMLHAYFSNHSIDYRYFKMNGKKKIYDKTKHGAFKHWELERCLDDKNCPLDSSTIQNLKFLIGVRHEIEHQMTQKIDYSISAKIQSCSINYNFYIKKLFGTIFGVDQELGLAIQFSPIETEQKATLIHNDKIANNIKNFITEFEDTLSDDDLGNTHYAYRVIFARVDGKRKNSDTDEVIRFLPADSPEATGLNIKYTLIRETEKKKYIANEIVQIMKDKGYSWFNVGKMTSYWQSKLKSRDEYGTYITKHQWMWYENWIPIIEGYCQQVQLELSNRAKREYLPNEIVVLMKTKGYSNFTISKLTNLWQNKLRIDRNKTEFGSFGQYDRFYWNESFLPLVEEYCKNEIEKK